MARISTVLPPSCASLRWRIIGAGVQGAGSTLTTRRGTACRTPTKTSALRQRNHPVFHERVLEDIRVKRLADNLIRACGVGGALGFHIAPTRQHDQWQRRKFRNLADAG